MKRYSYRYADSHSGQSDEQKDYLFIDIETTGFQRESTILTMIGLAFKDGSDLVIEQWFNECLPSYPSARSAFPLSEEAERLQKDRSGSLSPGEAKENGFREEKEMLLCLEQYLTKTGDLPVLIHYNGTTFDLPYLRSKYRQHHMDTSIPLCESVDLYQYAKKFRFFFSLDGLKQKHLEKAFGLFRTDTLSGKELIDAYWKGITENDETQTDLYLLHNKEDMEGMILLGNLLSLCQLFKEPPLNSSWSADADGILSVHIPLPFDYPLTLQKQAGPVLLTMNRGRITLRIPPFSMDARYFYPDYKNYYYLPEEDRAIHKSVASFVDKDFRTKATKETCYIRKSGTYYPVPLSDSRKARKLCLERLEGFELFYREYGDHTAYLSSSCSHLKTKEGRNALLKALLPLFLLDSSEFSD